MQIAKKHIITIAGCPGSGKSTTAKAVAAALEYSHFSSGDLFRALGQEHGIDVLQTNLSLEKNPQLDIDRLVDGKLQEIGQTEDKVVIDSRTAWHWIPASFKVFLDLDMVVGAARILDHMDEARRKSEHVPADPKAYAKMLEDRLASENRRYKSLYNIDPYDMRNYDLVIDTAQHDQGEVIARVLHKFERWLSQA